jgi:hypothetical protein
MEMRNGNDEVTPLDFLEAVYLNPNLPLSVRMRAAIEAAPYKHPKLSAHAISHMDGKSFAAALERAIERSKKPSPPPLPLDRPLIVDHGGPMAGLQRRF